MLKKLFGNGQILRQVVTLVSGTASAQILTVIAMVPLARMYGPEDFGLFAILQSIVTVGISIVSLRYDIAVVLPKSDKVARVLQRLASRTILIGSLLLSAVLFLAHPWLAEHYGNSPLAYWMVVSGLITYLMAQVVNVQFWLTRRQDYRLIAGNRLFQAVAVVSFQMLAWLWVRTYEGLIIGFLLGQALTLLIALRRAPELRGPVPKGSPSAWAVAKQYRKMPLVNGPTALLDAIRTSGINILIGNFGVSGLGHFSLAYQMTKAPVTVLTASVSQVLLKQLSITTPGRMLPFLVKSYSRISLFAIPAFVALYFLAPPLFPFIFGSAWEESGLIAQALVPWLFMLTFTSPTSHLLIVANKQEWGLIFGVVSTALPLLFLATTKMELLEAISILSLIMAGTRLLWVVMTVIVARHFDRRADELH